MSELNEVEKLNTKELAHAVEEVSEQEISEEELQQILEKIPDKEIETILQMVVHQKESFSGPFPHPRILKGYEEVGEGFADRVLSLTERQQAHRHALENKAVDANIATERRGQNYALIISLVMIIASAVLIISGNPASGTILGGSTLIGLAYIFITGRKKPKKNNEQSN